MEASKSFFYPGQTSEKRSHQDVADIDWWEWSWTCWDVPVQPRSENARSSFETWSSKSQNWCFQPFFLLPSNSEMEWAPFGGFQVWKLGIIQEEVECRAGWRAVCFCLVLDRFAVFFFFFVGSCCSDCVWVEWCSTREVSCLLFSLSSPAQNSDVDGCFLM